MGEDEDLIPSAERCLLGRSTEWCLDVPELELGLLLFPLSPLLLELLELLDLLESLLPELEWPLLWLLRCLLELLGLLSSLLDSLELLFFLSVLLERVLLPAGFTSSAVGS